MSIIEEIKSSYKGGSTLTKLLYINIAVFIVIRLLQIFFSLPSGQSDFASYQLLNWLSIPSDLLELAMKPWTLISYMFVHFNFVHLIFNMLYLYWFGRIFLEFLNPRQLLGVYFLGGISGAVVYLIAYNLLPILYFYFSSAILMGASASVMAILFSIARYMPNHTVYLLFFGPVRLKYIALAAFIIDLISIPTLKNTGGHLAHIGGATFGFLYGGWLLQGYDVTIGFNRFMDRIVGIFKRKSKLKVSHKRPMTDMEYNARKVKNQVDVDRILEKIKASGYDSLSKEEKTLFDASKE